MSEHTRQYAIGVALEPGVRTTGLTGVEKWYPRVELASATATLAGCPVDRLQSTTREISDPVGTVDDVRWSPDTGVVYAARVTDETTFNVLRRNEATIVPQLDHDPCDAVDGTLTVANLTFTRLFVAPEASAGVPGVIRTVEIDGTVTLS